MQVKVEQHVPYIDGAFSESSGTRGQDPAMLFDAPIDRFSLAYVFWVWEGLPELWLLSGPIPNSWQRIYPHFWVKNLIVIHSHSRTTPKASSGLL